MAGLIRRSDIDEVRARVNIADIVGDFVTLKSAGVGSLKGLCPFHDEKSPSFHVRPAVGRYKCFGCGEGGDVFTFLQRMDHVTFSEAVERMAARIGYELHYEDGGRTPDQGSRARLLAANEAAREFFVSQLGTEGAQEARRFLGARGFDAEAAREFGVGYAPQGWGNLTSALGARGFTEAELVAAGLLSTGERGRAYDRFRGRLIWPIRDQTGATIGFGARRLFDDDQGPKYLNTPETPVYHKSQVLYGLDLAKRDIGRNRQVVIVEGYTDVMACHLAGVTTAVATCGTSFGVDHIKVLRRVMGDDTSGLGEVVFTFDPDAAGQKAALRAFSEEQRFAAQTYVAVAPDGLDPCDLRLSGGNDAVRRLITQKRPMFEFVIRQRIAAFDLDSVEGRVGALRAAAPAVADIRDPALRPGYTRELARLTGMELAEVTAAVASAARRAAAEDDASRGASGDHRDQPGDRRDQHDRSPGDRARGSGGVNEPDFEPGPPPSIRLVDLPQNPSTRLERDALMAMLQTPTLVGHERMHRATQSAFRSDALAVVRDAIGAALDGMERPDWVEQVLDAAPAPYASLIEELAVAPLPERPERELRGYAEHVVAALIERDLTRRKDEVLGRLQRSDASADPDRYRALQRTLVELEAERRALRPE